MRLIILSTTLVSNKSNNNFHYGFTEKTDRDNQKLVASMPLPSAAQICAYSSNKYLGQTNYLPQGYDIFSAHGVTDTLTDSSQSLTNCAV